MNDAGESSGEELVQSEGVTIPLTKIFGLLVKGINALIDLLRKKINKNNIKGKPDV